MAAPTPRTVSHSAAYETDRTPTGGATPHVSDTLVRVADAVVRTSIPAQALLHMRLPEAPRAELVVALASDIIGGTGLFAVVRHGQVRDGIAQPPPYLVRHGRLTGASGRTSSTRPDASGWNGAGHDVAGTDLAQGSPSRTGTPAIRRPITPARRRA